MQAILWETARRPQYIYDGDCNRALLYIFSLQPFLDLASQIQIRTSRQASCTFSWTAHADDVCMAINHKAKDFVKSRNPYTTAAGAIINQAKLYVLLLHQDNKDWTHMGQLCSPKDMWYHCGFPLTITGNTKGHWEDKLGDFNRMMARCPSTISIPRRVNWINTYALSKIWHLTVLTTPHNAKEFETAIKARLAQGHFPWTRMFVSRVKGGLGLLDIRGQSFALQSTQVWRPWIIHQSITPQQQPPPLWLDWFTDQATQIYGHPINILSPQAKMASAAVSPCQTLRRLLKHSRPYPSESAKILSTTPAPSIFNHQEAPMPTPSPTANVGSDPW